MRIPLVRQFGPRKRGSAPSETSLKNVEILWDQILMEPKSLRLYVSYKNACIILLYQYYPYIRSTHRHVKLNEAILPHFLYTVILSQIK